MAVGAGARLPASVLAGVGRVVQSDTAGIVSTAYGTAFTDIPGSSVPFTLTGANAYIIIHQSIDVSVTVANAGRLLVVRAAWAGGTIQDQAGQLVVDDRDGRRTTSRSHKVSLAAGTYTFTQQVSKTDAALVCDVLGSTLLIHIFDIP